MGWLSLSTWNSCNSQYLRATDWCAPATCQSVHDTMLVCMLFSNLPAMCSFLFRSLQVSSLKAGCLDRTATATRASAPGCTAGTKAAWRSSSATARTSAGEHLAAHHVAILRCRTPFIACQGNLPVQRRLLLENVLLSRLSHAGRWFQKPTKLMKLRLPNKLASWCGCTLGSCLPQFQGYLTDGKHCLLKRASQLSTYQGNLMKRMAASRSCRRTGVPSCCHVDVACRLVIKLAFL